MSTTTPVEQVPSNEGKSRENREDRIRRAAYAAAERRGFVPGFETEDWLDAERQLDGESDEQAAPGSAP